MPQNMSPTTASQTRGSCFVISPIGDANSESRIRSDQVLKHVIYPATTAAGYTKENVKRSGQIPQPGMISSQVIQHLYDDDLVIADLSDHNANVFYELSFRHATRKPVVLLIRTGERIPFDVTTNRVIHYNLADWDSRDNCVTELTNQIAAALANPMQADNPISAGMTFKALSGSQDPTEQTLATLLPRLQSIEAALAQTQETLAALAFQIQSSGLYPPTGLYR